jgi:hypothetical protein
VIFRLISAAFAKATSKAQDYLEADPYWEQKDIPMQLFKAKEPFVGKVVSVKRVVGPQAVGETCDIIIDHQGKMPYWEGQSYGVIPPGKYFIEQRRKSPIDPNHLYLDSLS